MFEKGGGVLVVVEPNAVYVMGLAFVGRRVENRKGMGGENGGVGKKVLEPSLDRIDFEIDHLHDLFANLFLHQSDGKFTVFTKCINFRFLFPIKLIGYV